jgi:hypothetical protein
LDSSLPGAVVADYARGDAQPLAGHLDTIDALTSRTARIMEAIQLSKLTNDLNSMAVASYQALQTCLFDALM